MTRPKMSNARNGREREYRVARALEKQGWRLVMHAAASKGSADLLMVHAVHGAALIQVGGKSKTLGPEARTRLIADADDAGALALLAVPVTGIGFRYWHVGPGTPGTWTEWVPGRHALAPS